MVASILIIGISVLLLAYWLRYSCALVLRGRQERIADLQPDERFQVAGILDRARTESDLAQLERALERDYYVITYLIEHATDLELASIENRLLVYDYKLLRIWSRATRGLAPVQSRKALCEMATVLGALAVQMVQPGRLEMEA
jgi:hypothetical protein